MEIQTDFFDAPPPFLRKVTILMWYSRGMPNMINWEKFGSQHILAKMSLWKCYNFVKISEKCEMSQHYLNGQVSWYYQFELFWTLDGYLIGKKEPGDVYCFTWAARGLQKCDFCKKWLNFRIFTTHELFIVWGEVNPHLNRNHWLFIQNFNVDHFYW